MSDFLPAVPMNNPWPKVTQKGKDSETDSPRVYEDKWERGKGIDYEEEEKKMKEQQAIQKTDQEMIQAIVQAMVDGGYTHGYRDKSIEIDIIVNKNITFFASLEHVFASVVFEWLLFSSAAMKAAYGERGVCDRCGKPFKPIGAKSFCSNTEETLTVIPAYKYHQIEAIKRSGKSYIKYLYNNLPKGGGK